jgi:hypothetical protein
VMLDKSRLVRFRSDVFMRHLSKIDLDTQDQEMLRLLAIPSPKILASEE